MYSSSVVFILKTQTQNTLPNRTLVFHRKFKSYLSRTLTGAQDNASTVEPISKLPLEEYKKRIGGRVEK